MNATFLSTAINTAFHRFYQKLKSIHFLKLALSILLVGLNVAAYAQSTDTTLPTIDLGGASNQTDPLKMFIVAAKYLAATGIWAYCLKSGWTVLTSIYKAWQERSKDPEFKWQAVMGGIVGHIGVFMLTLIVALWVTNTFTK